MLILAAYRFETPNLNEQDRKACWGAVENMLETWLEGKGVSDEHSSSGTFVSKTAGKSGVFNRTNVTSISGELLELSLTEPTKEGHRFRTEVTILNYEKRISVYLTLSAAVSGSFVSPITLYPRCPTIIRELLRLRKDWMFGGSDIPPPEPIILIGAESATKLAGYIMNESRTLPVTVVSDLDGEPIWTDLPEKLSVDLAGLSSVVRIDGEASWELTRLLGKSRSCYLGAVRIYWPLNEATKDSSQLRSVVWTAERLLSNDADGKGLSRFTTSLRRRVMSIAALSIDAPPGIRTIKSENSRAKLAELESKADANTEELELARLFIDENETLKDELEQAKKEIAKQAARAEAAEYALEEIKSGGDYNVDDSDEPKRPTPGEVRYYKKTHSKPSYDVLVRISDCGHNKWQSANKADKAKKGIEKLEGRSDWKNVYHCGSCKGGGVWKVRW